MFVLITSQRKYTGNFPKGLGKNTCKKFIEFIINKNAFWNSPSRKIDENKEAEITTSEETQADHTC